MLTSCRQHQCAIGCSRLHWCATVRTSGSARQLQQVRDAAYSILRAPAVRCWPCSVACWCAVVLASPASTTSAIVCSRLHRCATVRTSGSKRQLQQLQDAAYSILRACSGVCTVRCGWLGWLLRSGAGVTRQHHRAIGSSRLHRCATARTSSSNWQLQQLRDAVYSILRAVSNAVRLANSTLCAALVGCSSCG